MGTFAHAERQPAAQAQSVGDILDALLTVERLQTTFYYVGLSSRGVMHGRVLAGASGDPNNPALPPGGNPHHVRYLQAALDAEWKHAAALVAAGASSPHGRFYFPARTFESLGTSTDRGSFLGVMEAIETIAEGLYLAAARAFLALGEPDLAFIAAEVMGVEAEHRMLGRVLARISPPTPIGLVPDQFATVDAAGPVLQPFITGRGFLSASAGRRAYPLPDGPGVARLVGKYGTRRVRKFLWT